MCLNRMMYILLQDQCQKRMGALLIPLHGALVYPFLYSDVNLIKSQIKSFQLLNSIPRGRPNH